MSEHLLNQIRAGFTFQQHFAIILMMMGITYFAGASMCGVMVGMRVSRRGWRDIDVHVIGAVTLTLLGAALYFLGRYLFY